MSISIDLGKPFDFSVQDLNNHEEPTLEERLKTTLSAFKTLNADTEAKFRLRTKSRKNKQLIFNNLTNLTVQLKKIEDKSNTTLVESLQNELVKVQDVIKPHLSMEEPIRPKIDFGIGVFLDIDAPDHNGAMILTLEHYVEQNLPFITTRSLLRGKGLPSDLILRTLGLEEKLLNTVKNWDIFQQEGSEFILFFPKSFQADLKKFDFVSDGSLKPISMREALQESKGKGSIEDLMRLFTTTPTKNKTFFINGHGNSKHVAALNEKNYLKLLDFLEFQNCKALTISSCHSGGESSLLTIPKGKRSFTTVVLSIGDFTTFLNHDAEKNKSGYDKGLQELLSTQVETTPTYRRFIETVESNQEKSLWNYNQIYFPHTTEVSRGFRPLGERGIGYTLTYNVLKQKELEKEQKLYVKNKQLLEIYPLAIHFDVVFSGNNPYLLSMVPGKSCHFIQSCTLAEETFSNFFSKQATFYKSIGVQKSFFIGSLSAKDETLTEVVVFLEPGGCSFAYRLQDRYYYSKGKISKKITASDHTMLVKHIITQTTPMPSAVKAASGGQDHFENFELAIADSFWDPSKELPKIDVIDINILNGKSPISLAIRQGDLQKVKELLEKGAPLLAEDEPLHQAVLSKKIEMVQFLLTHPSLKFDINQPDIEKGSTPIMKALDQPDIFNLLKENGASLDALNHRQFTLPSASSYSDNLKMVELLLKEGVDPNLGSPTPLLHAIQNNNLEMVKLLLNHGAKISLKDKSGKLPLIEAALKASPEILELLVSQASEDDLTAQNSEDSNALMAALLRGNEKHIEILFKKKAPLPKDIWSVSSMKMLVHRYSSLDELDSMKILIQLAKSTAWEPFISEFLFDINREWWNELTKSGILSPEMREKL